MAHVWWPPIVHQLLMDIFACCQLKSNQGQMRMQSILHLCLLPSWIKPRPNEDAVHFASPQLIHFGHQLWLFPSNLAWHSHPSSLYVLPMVYMLVLPLLQQHVMDEIKICSNCTSTSVRQSSFNFCGSDKWCADLDEGFSWCCVKWMLQSNGMSSLFFLFFLS